MRPSPLLSAAAAAALVAAVAGPASAATAPAATSTKAAQGLATSGVTLLGLAAGGRTLSAGQLELLSDTLQSSPLAQVVVTPLTVDGTAYGRRTVSPGDAPFAAPALSSTSVVPSLLAGLLSVQSPTLRAAASEPDGGAATEAGAADLGGVSLLGLPLALDGSLDVGSVVTRAGAVGQQTVRIDQLALPSIADLLGALGLDVSKVPTDVLVELLTELDLLTTTVTTADKAVDDVQAQLTKATADVAKQVTAVDDATKALTAENAALTALNGVLGNADLAAARAAATEQLRQAELSRTAAQASRTAAAAAVTTLQTAYDAAPALLKPALKPALDAAKTTLTEADALLATAVATATTAATTLANATSVEQLRAAALAAATSAVALAQAALATANALLDAAQKAVTDLLGVLKPLVETLLAAVTAVLDGTPLVSLDSLKVVSNATATSAAPGGQGAEVTGGEVTGLEVLGTDVLANVLQRTTVDLTAVTGAQLAQVNALLARLTGTLSEVLSTVPGFPALSVPAPKVELLTKAVRTGQADGFGSAGTDLRALSITLPAISVPTALALPGAASLPALSGVTQSVTGLLTSAPVKLDLANLGNAVRFSPAVAAAGTPTTGTPTTGQPTTGQPTTGVPTTGVPTTGTPTTGRPAVSPQLPRTGAEQALAVLGLALLAGAFVTRRRATV